MSKCDMSGVVSPMTLKQKKKWVKALLSGNYEQGTGALHPNGGTHCCLGVAQKALSLKVEHHGMLSNDSADGRAQPVFLPMKVQNELAALNDMKVPFELIAGLVHHTL